MVGVTHRPRRATGPKCPECSATVKWKEIDYSWPCPCPFCCARVRISRAYLTCQFFITFLTLGSVAYLCGARGFVWIVIVIVGYFPLDLVIASGMLLYAPPRLHLDEDVQSILRGRRGQM